MDAVTLGAAKSDARRRYRRLPVHARGILCLVGDDLLAEHYTWLMPKVEALGGHMTFGYYSSGVDNGPTHMTSAQVTDAHARGHEIASHSEFHQDMTSLTAAAREPEWSVPKSEIFALTGETPTSWIYPVSARNAVTDAEAYFHYQRTFWGVNGQFVVPIDSDIIPFAVGRFSLTAASQQRALELVRLAAYNPVRIIIYTHGISDTGNITTTLMQEILDLVESLGVPLATLQEAFPAHRPVPDRVFSGFTNTPTTDVWTTTSTGSGTTAAQATGTGPSGLSAASTSLKLSSTDATATRTATLGIIKLPTRPGKPYFMSAWVKLAKTSGSGGAYLALDEYDIVGNLLVSTPVAEVTAATAGLFTYKSRAWNLHPETRQVVPRLYIANLVGDAYFTNVWCAETAESMVTPPSPDFDPYRGVTLTSGEATLLRDDITTETAAATGSLRLTYFTAKKTEDITQIKAYSGTTSAGATPTLARLGVYVEDPTTGDLTLLAATANDTALFATINTVYTKTLTSTFHKVKGQRYAVADLVVSGATMPKLMGAASASGNLEYGIAPRLTGNLASQTDLPATITAASITSSAARRYMALLP